MILPTEAVDTALIDVCGQGGKAGAEVGVAVGGSMLALPWFADQEQLGVRHSSGYGRPSQQGLPYAPQRLQSPRDHRDQGIACRKTLIIQGDRGRWVRSVALNLKALRQYGELSL